MPIYEYQCPECHTVFEEWQSISAAKDFFACPQCTAMSSRIISNTAFVLKGSGWYVTEYGNRKTNQDSSSAKTAVNSVATQSADTVQAVEKTEKKEPATSQSSTVVNANTNKSSAANGQSANA